VLSVINKTVGQRRKILLGKREHSVKTEDLQELARVLDQPPSHTTCILFSIAEELGTTFPRILVLP
jgi:hypothetical protein